MVQAYAFTLLVTLALVLRTRIAGWVFWTSKTTRSLPSAVDSRSSEGSPGCSRSSSFRCGKPRPVDRHLGRARGHAQVVGVPARGRDRDRRSPRLRRTTTAASGCPWRVVAKPRRGWASGPRSACPRRGRKPPLSRMPSRPRPTASSAPSTGAGGRHDGKPARSGDHRRGSGSRGSLAAGLRRPLGQPGTAGRREPGPSRDRIRAVGRRDPVRRPRARGPRLDAIDVDLREVPRLRLRRRLRRRGVRPGAHRSRHRPGEGSAGP